VTSFSSLAYAVLNAAHKFGCLRNFIDRNVRNLLRKTRSEPAERRMDLLRNTRDPNFTPTPQTRSKVWINIFLLALI